MSKLNLKERFALSVVMSATPAESQRILANKHPEKNADCSPSDAMICNLICKPTLNLIKIVEKNQLVNGIISMIKREESICATEPFRVKSLVCCTDIITANNIYKTMRKEDISKNWHYIIIHSDKKVGDNGEIKVLESEIDGKPVDSRYIIDILENKVDKDIYTPFANDNEPIIVLQVDMISEGINIKSFNSVLITSHSDRTQIQQIGRVIRDCIIFKNNIEYSKIENGHSNVYCVYNNKSEIADIFDSLATNRITYFNWGAHVDIINGTTPSDPNKIANYEEIKWESITEVIKDIEEIRSCRTIKNSSEKDKYFNRMVEIFSKYSKELSSLLSKDASALKSINHLPRKSKQGKGKVSTASPKNNTPPKSSEEKKKKKTCEDIINIVERIWNIILTKVSKEDGKNIVRPLFDNDIDYYKSVMECIGVPKEVANCLNDYFTECKGYMNLS